MAMLSEKVGDVTIVVLPEELDASHAPQFRRDIAPVLEANSKVVFDVSHLRFVDSSGLGAILSCLRRLNARGGDLQLCGLSPSIRAPFALVRMHTILKIYGTRDEAIRAFQA
jgi:anti-sigma B factor antagonist